MHNDVVFLDICDLDEFADHPYKLHDDYAMEELTESIKTLEVSYLDTKH